MAYVILLSLPPNLLRDSVAHGSCCSLRDLAPGDESLDVFRKKKNSSNETFKLLNYGILNI
jgi:hypothetical protein